MWTWFSEVETSMKKGADGADAADAADSADSAGLVIS